MLNFHSHSTTRIGFIHIPGSMGISISDAIAKALKTDYFAIHVVAKDLDVSFMETYTLRLSSNPDSLARDMLLAYPLISGHLAVGQIQATNRTHIFTVVTEPRRRLIKLFAHHGAAGLCFSDWLSDKVNLQSDIIDFLAQGGAWPPSGVYQELHSQSYREPTSPTWHYGSELVETIVSPIDFIFFASNPQFVLDTLYHEQVLPQQVQCEHHNSRDPFRRVDWGDLTAASAVLKHVTLNDYKFIDHMRSRAKVDPQFEIWDDAKTYQFLVETAGTS